MCTSNSKSSSIRALYYSFMRRRQSKPPKVQVHRLTRRRCGATAGKDLELQNLKLYLQNQIISEENEKLRKKAICLHQENLVLMSQLENKFLHLESCSATI